MKIKRVLVVLIIAISFALFCGFAGFKIREGNYTVTGLSAFSGALVGLLFGLAMTGPEDPPAYIDNLQPRKKV